MHIFRHFWTVTRHRHMVMRHCFRAGIIWRGLTHDLSKYSPAEFLPGARYYQGYRSPNERERETMGFSLAWMHHKGRNRHHFEYWTDYDPVTKRMTPAPMPRVFVAEMFCDRVAAGKIYGGDAYTDASPLAYFEKGRATRQIHPQTAAELERLLVMLAEQGEGETFRFLRRWVREERGENRV